MKLNIVFISSNQYPNGGASSIRHLSYARGLVELGHQVSFILLSEQNENSSKSNGIKFISIFKSSDNKLTRKLIKKALFLRIKRAKTKLREINNEHIVNAVVLLDVDPKIIEPIISYCKEIKIPIFHERTEYPFLVKENYKGADKDLDIYLRSTIQQFDGIYVITDALVKYFKDKTEHKVPIKKILMTVEPDRFENSNSLPPFGFDYIAYSGTMYSDKDGVPILIKAFSLISGEFPETKIVLIGDIDNVEEINKLNNLIDSLKLKDKVVFTGRVPRNEVPRFLIHAKALCLARPNNKQAEGGFPTKLGEYLATKRPVVITNVGEITNFLKDEVHAFIVEPDSEISFAKKLKFVLNNMDYANQVGITGNKLVYEVFNYKAQAEKLARFFNDRN